MRGPRLKPNIRERHSVETHDGGAKKKCKLTTRGTI